MRAGRQGRGGRGGSNRGGGWQSTREAYLEHVLRVRDAGGKEAQRLVERLRLLPSREGSVGRGATCGPDGARAWGGSSASSALGGVQLWRWLAGHERSARKTCSSCP